MQILLDDAHATTVLAGTGVRVLLFNGPTDSQTNIARFSQIRWPAGMTAAVLPTHFAPITTARYGVTRTPAVGAILDGHLIVMEYDADPRAAAVRAVARARAGPACTPVRHAG